MKKILVIDGNSIINRAFYGIKPLTTKSGKFTNAIYGMINIISKQLAAISPDYCAVAFDLKSPTFRHKMYGEYKAGRHATPEELRSQFPDAKECLALMGLNIMELEGYEADDIQGTVAKLAHSADDIQSYVLSGDRDLLQLIDDKVTVLLATNSDTVAMHRDEFFEKYGIEPEQFVDMKALMGDSSDNIPGVAGVGEKTAGNLIRDFGSLDAIYENIEDKRISKGVREKLLRDKENAYLSRELARIDINAPIKKTLEELKINELDKVGLYKKFTELELNSFINKFALLEKQDKSVTPDSSQLLTAEYCESESLSEFKERLAVEQLDGSFYISDGEKSIKYTGDCTALAKCLEGREIICYDGKALLHKLSSLGANISGIKALDLLLYGYVLNPGAGTGKLSSLCAMFLGSAPEEDKPKAHLMPALEEVLSKEIEDKSLSRVLFELEIPLINVLTEIEQSGFKVNTEGMREFCDALDGLAAELTTIIYTRAGKEFNINSPKQLGEVLFEDLGLPYKKKKSKGSYSTDAQTLEELRSYNPIIDDILEYRQVVKLAGTYASALPKVADENSRIHTDFKQALTATGRLSSADPNLQNIPIKTKMGRELRRYFTAEEGYTLVDADYSQIELRLLAHIADDYNMKEAFLNGDDIHRKTAAAVFGIPEEAVTAEMRKSAKAVNFGIVYGIGAFSLAKDIGTSNAEAGRYIKSYLMNYPSVAEYLENVVVKATEDGYTATPIGRRRYIPELNSSNGMLRAFGKRVAMNAPIQGAAADIMKLAMINVSDRLKSERLDARIVMQVHDELIVEVKETEALRCAEILKEEMEGAYKISVPLTVDVSVGKNWLEQADI